MASQTNVSQSERIRRALAIEQREFGALEERLAMETEVQSLNTREAYASKGASTSGGLIVVLMELQVTRLRAVVRGACERRRTMVRTVPELGYEDQINALRDRLSTWLDMQWGALPAMLSRYFGYVGVSAEVLQWVDRVSDTLLSLKNELARELDNIKDEVALGMHQPRSAGPGITITITGGTVGGVNLGSIIGDMNVAIDSVHQAGGETLAQAIKRVTEAIDNEASLNPDKRAEVIETLAAITQEAALPPQRRKWHLVRSLLAHAGTIILKVPQLVDAWTNLSTQVTKWFGQNPPGT
jgi:hypothetical protein